MDHLLDSRFLELEREAVHLGRLCFRVALGIEIEQPATTLRLLEAVYNIRYHISDCAHPFTRGSIERDLLRARRALLCVAAILQRQHDDGEGPRAQITAALEIAERLGYMLENPPPIMK